MKDWEELKKELIERNNRNYDEFISDVIPDFQSVMEKPENLIEKIESEEEFATYLDSHLYGLIENKEMTQDMMDRYSTFLGNHGIATNIEEYLQSWEERRREWERSYNADEEKDVKRRWRRQLGERLRVMRTVRNMTMRQASELSGVDKNAISRIEAGRANAAIDSIFALIEAYKDSMIIDYEKREIR